MADQVIKLGMDVSDVSAASAQFVQMLQSQEAAVEGVFRKMATVNKEGEVTRATFAKINEDGSQVEATLKKVANGWQVVATKVKEAAQVMKDAKDAQATALANQRAGQAEKILGGLDTQGGIPTGSLNAVDSAIQRIKESVASGKVSVEQFQALFDKFSKDPKGLFPDLSGDEAKVVRALRTIQDAIDKGAASRQKAADQAQADAQKEEAALKKVADAAKAKADAQARGQQAGTILSQAFDFSKVDPSRIASVEAAIQRVKQLVASGAVDIQRFQEILNAIKADPNKILPDLSAQEQKLASAIRTIVKGLSEDVPTAGEKAKSIFISLGGVLRLLEAQILKRIFSTFENELLQSISAAQKFMLQVAEIRTISQNAQLSTEKWSQSITELSSAFGKNRSDVAEATYQTLSNQVAHGAESFKFLETSLRFSQATVSSAADSVNLLSGALKSFQLPTSDAEKVAAVLFKTIELGRVRAKDMANTFGRIGTIAKDAGVSLEETSAAIAVLTIRGIKFNDASTLIQNLLLKLIRPTDDMKKLFEQWGVASGTAAIATFGFQGVLAKLDEEAQKGTGHLGDILGQIRAIRGAVGLTGAAFNDFNASLSKIKNSQESYNKAVQEVQESPAQRAQKQITDLRNFFQQDFGEPFVRGMLRITEAMGGAVNIVKVLTVAVQAGVGAYVAYRLVLVAFSPAMATVLTGASALTAVQTAWTATTIAAGTAYTYLTTTSIPAMIAALGRLTVAAAAAAVPFAALAAAFAVGYYTGNQIWGQAEKDLTNFAARAKEVTEAQKKARSGIDETEQRKLNETTDRVKSEYGKRIQTVLQFSSRVIQQANSMKSAATDALKATTENLKTSSNSYFDALRRNVAGFNEEASRAKANIRQSLKESEDLPRRAQNKIFDEKLKYASPGYQDSGTGFIVGNQQIDLIKNRIKQVAEQARSEMAKGTTEGAQEARKLFNDLQGLQSQLFEKEVEQQKKIFEFRVKTGQQQPTSYDSMGKPRYEFTVRTKDVEQQINKLTEERLQLEEKFRKQQEEIVKKKQAAADAEKDRIRQLQQQFQLLEKIDVFTKEGKLKKEYQGPEGLQKALKEFEERRSKIMELAGKDADPSKGFQVFLDLQKQRDALINQVRTAQASESAGKIQEQATQDLKAVDNLATKAKEKVTKGTADIEKYLAGINRQLQLYKEAVEKPIPTNRFGGVDQKSEPAREDAVKKLQELEAARDAFNASGGRTVENANKVKAAVEAANQAILEYMRQRQLGDPSQVGFAGDPKRTVKDQNAISSSVADSLVQATQQVAAGNATLKQAEDTITRTEQRLRAIPGALQAMNEAAVAAAPATQASFQSLANAAEQYAIQLERINQALASQPAPPQPAPQPAPDRMFGGPMPKYFASGGYVGFVPRGSDQIPAMLGRDEFVMTGAATRQFKPLLEAMNQGTMPRYMAQGGPVTNVGDITVNVSGGQTDEHSLRNIAQGLRRGIRRGTISLTK